MPPGARGILVPRPGIGPASPALEGGSLTLDDGRGPILHLYLGSGAGAQAVHEAHRLQAKALGEFIYRKVTATGAHTGSRQKTPDLSTQIGPSAQSHCQSGPCQRGQDSGRVGGRKGTGQVPEGKSQSDKWPSSLNCGLGGAGGEGRLFGGTSACVQPAPLKPGMRTEAPVAAGGSWGHRRPPADLSRRRRGAAVPGHSRHHTGGAPSLLVALVTRLFSRRFRRRALRLLISST